MGGDKVAEVDVIVSQSGTTGEHEAHVGNLVGVKVFPTNDCVELGTIAKPLASACGAGIKERGGEHGGGDAAGILMPSRESLAIIQVVFCSLTNVAVAIVVEG